MKLMKETQNCSLRLPLNKLVRIKNLGLSQDFSAESAICTWFRRLLGTMNLGKKETEIHLVPVFWWTLLRQMKEYVIVDSKK